MGWALRVNDHSVMLFSVAGIVFHAFDFELAGCGLIRLQ